MNNLEKAKAECLQQRDMPEGYKIEPDYKTWNLMVYGPTQAFCITSKAIQERLHLTQFGPAFDALVVAEQRPSV
ncbi:hypothetical protein IC762_12260 [Bradyrhizobium genosp. L]|uniref:hypothetical protein n=1 Tax=Bradyrhizobium genosp. L TaxID=83637 RepID=UPI0018A29892|nr:hypothetical protein [Bradyrhizobium genosp. L]QPF87018.1 hypothetical protein IC762_12260 [Bradyrhizobium genosp. L]